MVKEAVLFNNLVEKKEFRDRKDIDALLNICKAYPNFKLPYILLLNYQPDIFNHDFWAKGEEFLLQSKSDLKSYFQVEKITEKAPDSMPRKDFASQAIDQKSILQNFLTNPLPKFI
jgi:hypothetical protein